MTGPTFRQQWRDAIRDSDAPEVADTLTVMVAMALDRDMSADGRTKAGTRRLGALARCHKETAAGRVERLIDAGWLRREWAGRGHEAVYFATIPPTVGGPEPPTSNGQSGRTRTAHPDGGSGRIPPGEWADSPAGVGGSEPPRSRNHPPGNHPPVVQEEAAREHTSGAVDLDRPPDDDDDLVARFAQRITTPPERLDPDEIPNRVAELITRHGTEAVGHALDDLDCEDPDAPKRYRWPRELATILDSLAGFYAVTYGPDPRHNGARPR